MPKSIKLLFVLLLVSWAGMAMLSAPTFVPMGIDQQIYVLMGKIVSAGGEMYGDMFDHKGPFFHFLNVLGYLLTGDEWGIWFVFQFIGFGSYLVLFWGIRKWSDDITAVVLTMALIFMYKLDNSPDALAYYCNCLGIGVLLLRGITSLNSILMGLLATCIFFSKQTCLGLFISFALYLLLNIRRLKKCLMAYLISGGLFVGMGLAVIYLEGIFPAYWDCCFRFNVCYAASNGGSHFIGKLMRMWPWFAILLTPLLLTVFALFKTPVHYDRKMIACWFVWVLIELFQLISGRGPWQYQVVNLSLLLVLPSIAFGKYVASTMQRGMWIGIGFCYLLFVAGFVYERSLGMLYYCVKTERRSLTGGADKTREDVEFLKCFRASDLFVEASQGALFYLYSDMKNPFAPYYYPVPLSTKGYVNPSWIKSCFEKLNKNKTIFILDAKDPFARSSDFEKAVADYAEKNLKRVISPSGKFAFWVPRCSLPIGQNCCEL